MINISLSGINKLHQKGRILFDLNTVASERNLLFSLHDKIGDNFIAMDFKNKILVHLNTATAHTKGFIIDLKKVVSASLIKQYNNIRAGDLDNRPLHHYLTKIFLHLRFNTTTGSLLLPFYDNRNRGNIKRNEIEEMAGSWQQLISLQLVKNITQAESKIN
jgi:hypothetical protein